MSVRTGRQLSLFGVEANDPSPADLNGLLAGPGQIVRMGGTARVSVVVDAAWRVHVLVAELAARGLAASWVTTADSHLGVRTAYASTLAPLSIAWLRGAVKRPPAGFHLDGPRLRLWAAAAGTPSPLGYQLRLGPSDEACWEAVGAALSAIGLPAVLVGPRAGDRQRAQPVDPARLAGPGGGLGSGAVAGPASAVAGSGGYAGPAGDAEPGAAAEPGGGAGLRRDAGSGADARPGEDAEPDPAGPAEGLPPGPARISGPAYRITGRRRLARLAELVGECPPAAPADAWPA